MSRVPGRRRRARRRARGARPDRRLVRLGRRRRPPSASPAAAVRCRWWRCCGMPRRSAGRTCCARGVRAHPAGPAVRRRTGRRRRPDRAVPHRPRHRPAGRLTAAELSPWCKDAIHLRLWVGGFAEFASRLLVELGCPGGRAGGAVRAQRDVLTPGVRGPLPQPSPSLPSRQGRDAGRRPWPMTTTLRRDLLWRIEARRASIQAYLREHRRAPAAGPRSPSSSARWRPLFTAGPAAGRRDVRHSRCRTASGLASDSYVWRTLCFLALLVSIASAILVNLGKASDEVAG